MLILTYIGLQHRGRSVISSSSNTALEVRKEIVLFESCVRLRHQPREARQPQVNESCILNAKTLLFSRRIFAFLLYIYKYREYCEKRYIPFCLCSGIKAFI